MAERENSTVEVRPSKIGGLGVVVLNGIRADEVIQEFAVEREITRADPLRAGEKPEHAFLSDGRFLLTAAPDRHFNHSCDPNAYLRYIDSARHVVARRDIAPDDEINVDYLINNSGGESWPCHCGAHRCRGLTGTSFFELPLDFQREYLALLAPWFRLKHPREMETLRCRLRK